MIKDILNGGYEVYSKGGTTFRGERRDIAVVKKISNEEGEQVDRQSSRVGYVILVQVSVEKLVGVTLADRIQAKLRRGRLHKHLVSVDTQFQQEAGGLLQRKLGRFQS